MLTLRYVPYAEIAQFPSEERLDHLLDLVKEEHLLVLDGRLTPREETELIRRTMERISNSFSGIEIASVVPSTTLRAALFDRLSGMRRGMTLIGPASLIKEVRKDLDALHLVMNQRAR